MDVLHPIHDDDPVMDGAPGYSGRFGFAYTPAFGRADAPSARLFFGTRERVPFQPWRCVGSLCVVLAPLKAALVSSGVSVLQMYETLRCTIFPVY